MKLRGRDHPITITRNAKRVRVHFGGTVIADTTHALTLQETGYRPVQYIPRADVAMSLLTPTAHGSHCPYKGDANYFSIVAGGNTAGNAVWSYEQPYPAMAKIVGYLAFYPNRVDGIEESPAASATIWQSCLCNVLPTRIGREAKAMDPKSTRDWKLVAIGVAVAAFGVYFGLVGFQVMPPPSRVNGPI